MKEGKASRPADIAIMYRAAEAWKRPEDRVCYDPFAQRFLRGSYRWLSSNVITRNVGLWYAEKISPGSRGWTVARHRFNDECLKHCVADGKIIRYWSGKRVLVKQPLLKVWRKG